MSVFRFEYIMLIGWEVFVCFGVCVQLPVACALSTGHAVCSARWPASAVTLEQAALLSHPWVWLRNCISSLSLSSGWWTDAVFRCSSAQEQRRAGLSVSQRFLHLLLWKPLQHTHTLTQPTQAYAAYVDMFSALKLTPQRDRETCGESHAPVCLSVCLSRGLKQNLNVSWTDWENNTDT